MRRRIENTKPSLLRRALSCLVSAAMVAAFTPAVAWGAEGDVSYQYRTENGIWKNGSLASGGYTPVSSGTVSWGSASATSWYVLDSDVTISQDVTFTGDVRLLLAEGCTLTVTGSISGGSVVGGKGSSLTIYGQAGNTGMLNVQGSITGGSGSGGGGGLDGISAGGTGGSITIIGGTVVAGTISGGSGSDSYSAGGAGGVVAIGGGTVKAAAKISGGSGGSSKLLAGGAGGSVTICDGAVEGGNIVGGAGGNGGVGGTEGIGGNGGAGGGVTISGGMVAPSSITGGNGGTGGSSNSGSGGDGTASEKSIGGNGGNGGSITINGGTVEGGSIAGGNGGTGGIGDSVGAGGNGGDVLISGDTVKAAGNIAGGTGGASYVTYESAVILSGTGGSVIISAGAVEAANITGGTGGSGTLSKTCGIGGEVSINGGVVKTLGAIAGGSGGSSISGTRGSSGTFSAAGNAVVFANSVEGGSDTAGWSGVIFEGSAGKIYGSSIALDRSFTIPTGKTLRIESGQNLTVSSGMVLTNSGTIELAKSEEYNEDGSIVDGAQLGTLTNNGVIFDFGTINGSVGGSGSVVKADAPVAASGLVFCDDKLGLIANETESLEYRLAGSTEWSTDIPSATKAGTYTVYYRLASGNFTSAELSLDVSIAKAKPTITASSENVEVGEYVTVTACPSNVEEICVQKTSWSEPKVLSVENGAATFQMPSSGTFVFTAKYNNDNYETPASCEVTAEYRIDMADDYSGIGTSKETTVELGDGQAIKVSLQDPLKLVKVQDLDETGVRTVLRNSGTGSSQIYVPLRLDLSNLGSTINHVNFTKSTFESISSVLNESGNNAGGMSLKMSNGSVELDKEALAAIASQITGEEVTISIEEKNLTSLKAPQQSVLKRFPAVGRCFDVSASSGGEEVHDLGGGTANITLSNEGEPTYNANLSFDVSQIEGLEPVLIYADDDGNVEYGDSEAQEIDGKEYLATQRNHFSVYAIVYVQPTEATKAAVAALEALPQAGELKAAGAKAAVKAAKAALKQVAALEGEQRAVVGKALVDNAEGVVERGNALVAKADEKAANKVRDKVFSVKAGTSKSIAFKTKASSAGTKVVYKKTNGSKYISVTKAGKVTVKKGMKPGKKYTAKVKVTCGSATRTVKVTVRAR